MRRLLLVAALAAIATGAWWLAEDGNLRRHLGRFVDEVLIRAGMGPKPSWGDVAAKVGEFAAEERDLKRIVGSGRTAPDLPAPEPLPD